MINKPNAKKAADIIFVILLAAGVFLLVDRVKFGYHYTDEPFYLCTAYRMLQGDRLIVDDGSVQLYSILLYPLMKLFYALRPDGEGLILTFRYVFVAMQTLTALLVYIRMRRVRLVSAIAFAMLMLIQAPNNFSAVSYYSLGIDAVCICCVLAATAENKRAMFLAGLALAAAVLCNPYLAILYAVYAAAVLIWGISGKERPYQLKWGGFWLFTLGAGVLAVIFFVYLFSNATLSEILGALPNYVENDSYYVGNELARAGQFFIKLYNEHIEYYIAAVIAAAAWLINRGKGETKNRKALFSAVIAVFYLIMLCLGFKAKKYEEAINPVIIIPALGAYLLSDGKDRRLMYCVYLPGILCGAMYFIASNGFTDRFGTGGVIAAGAGLFFIEQLCEELWSGERKSFLNTAAALLSVFAVVCQFGIQLYIRKNNFRPSLESRVEMYCTIDYGVAKGEVMSEVCHEFEFRQLEEAAMPVRNAQGEYVLYFSSDPHLYLSDTKKCSAKTSYTSYFWDADREAAEILKYWERHPERKPDALYISKEGKNVEKAVEMLNTEHFDVRENDLAYILIRPER